MNFVKPFEFGNGIAFEFGAIQTLFPAEQQFSKLRAPIADVVVADDTMAEQAQRALQRVADPVERMWPTCIGLATFGELKSMTTVFGCAAFGKKQMFAARGGFQRLRQDGIFQPEIQEAGTGDLHLFANIRNIEFRNNIGGKLARIQFPRFGQRHQRVGLVVAKFGIRARTDQNGGDIGVRQDGADGGLQFRLNLFVRKHDR